MNSKILLTSFFSLLICSVFAQPSFEWANSHGSTSTERGSSVVTDASGNIITVGEFRNTVDFDPGAGVSNLVSNGSADIFIQKVDNLGGLTWVKQIGGTSGDIASSIKIDNNGDYIITGSFRETVDLDPGAGVANFTATGGDYDAFVLKLNSAGDFQWAKVLDSDINHCYADELTVDTNNDLVILGRWFGTADFDPGVGTQNLTATGVGWNIFVLKLNTSGDYVWVKQIASPLDTYVQGFASDQNDAILISGYFEQSIDVDPGPGVVNLINAFPGQEDVFIVKLNSSGIYEWSHHLASTGINSEICNAIAVDSNNDYYFGGGFAGTVDFEPGPGVTNLVTTGDRDIFLLKTSAAGVLQWVNQMGGASTDEIWSMSVDSQDNIIAGGIFLSTADFNPGVGTVNLTSNGVRDIFILRMDQVGALDWAVSMGGTGQDYLESITTGTNGQIISTGRYEGTMDFDPGVGTSNETSNGSSDFFVHKLSDCVSAALTPDLLTLNDINEECAAAMPAAPTASNCSGTYTGTPDVTFPVTAQGTTVVTWTYDDGNGNTSTQTQNVIINDITAPVPDNNTLTDVIGECEITSLTSPTASDNCAGSVIVTNDATLPINNQGTTVVTWTYDDGNGNTSTQTQNVVITDVTAPVPDIANLVDYSDECPVELATIGGTPTATDNCSGAINGTPDVTFPITASGTTTITWTYDDGNGNTSTQTQDVTITPIDNGITQVDAVTLSADATAAAYTYQWVDCDNGNAPVNGATNQTFTPTVAGNYACVIDNGFCSATTDCLTSSVGIVENSFGTALVVYPNPTLGQLKIDLGDTYDGTSVKVLNALGQAVINESFGSTNEIVLNIEGTPGMYILEVKAENGKAAKVTIVKK